MKRLPHLLLTMALLCCCLAARGQMAVGAWRDCLSYADVLQVEEADGCVYAAVRGGVFCLDTVDYTLRLLNKTTGLSDIGVSAMGYDPLTSTLVVAYSNGNLDLVRGRQVYNLSDIKRAEVAGDKTVLRVRVDGHRAYVCCGFGVVVVDLDRREVEETLYLGDQGGLTPVYDMAFAADSIYAATGRGLLRVGAGERHLGVAERWTLDARVAHPTMLAVADGSVLVATWDFDPELFTLLRLAAGGLDTVGSGPLRELHANSVGVALTYADSVVGLSPALQRLTRNEYVYANDALMATDSTLWVGTSGWGLAMLEYWGYSARYQPTGPASDAAFALCPTPGRMLLCPGGFTTTYSSTYTAANLAVASGRSWENIGFDGTPAAGCHDLVAVAVNPLDTTEFFAALWEGGVVAIRDGVPYALYDQTNTGGALEPFVADDYVSLRPGSLAFDRAGNLWTLTALNSHALARRSPDGSWRAFPTSTMVDAPYVSHLLYDTVRGYLFFYGRPNTIYVHDGENRMARIDPNNGAKLTTESVNAMAQDHDGNLWVGTNKGVKVIYNAYSAFNGGGGGEVSPVACSNITITNGEFAEYLMAYENITAVAVDGANCKWVGTAGGGLYRISANGMDQLEHFTVANSPLFSNKIVALAIQPVSGELYVATDQGTQVYRATATYAEAIPADTVRVFPNPVRPDYDGPVAIKGLTRNALVRITDAAGHTVFSTTADGGQAIWYARTHTGRRVASGVYYIFASDAQGQNRSVGKVLVVN